MRTLTVIVLVVSLAGCSFFMKRLPGDWDGSTPPECNDSGLAPAVDLSVATAAAVAAVFGGVLIGQEWDCSHDCIGKAFGEVVLTSATVVGLPYLISGIFGRSNISRCRSAQRRYVTE